MFALAVVPILFGLGMSLDYGAATKRRAHLNAAADAAALAAVTPTLMNQLPAAAQTNAILLFKAQAQNTSGIDINKINLNVTVTDTNSGSNLRMRTAVVTYSVPSTNVFGSILHMPTMTIGGTSTSSATVSPNIDFYLMLDTSPSMAIPATQDGINAIVAATPYQDGGNGCAFACHEANPAFESKNGSPSSPKFGNAGCPDDPKKRSGPCLDNYTLAKTMNPPLVLRMDLVNQAVVNLVDTAQASQSNTGAAYRLAAYTFDSTVSNPVPLQSPTSSTKTQAASGINMLVVANENSNNGDQNTVFDGPNGGFTKVTADMNAANNGSGAGAGSNILGGNPQQVLMIVSDGVADEPNSSGSRIYTPLGYTTSLNANPISTSTCDTIKKNTNVRIAVLYLTYNPLPLNNGNSWYAKNVAGEQPKIATAMQNCASPGLFYQVNTGGDVTAAMNTLFQSAVKSAHLTN